MGGIHSSGKGSGGEKDGEDDDSDDDDDEGGAASGKGGLMDLAAPAGGVVIVEEVRPEHLVAYRFCVSRVAKPKEVLGFPRRLKPFVPSRFGSPVEGNSRK
jgi:hypothetical protein